MTEKPTVIMTTCVKDDRSRHGRAKGVTSGWLSVTEGPCGLETIALFQAVLPQYQIKVMTVDPPYGIIYKGPVADKHDLVGKDRWPLRRLQVLRGIPLQILLLSRL